MQEVIRVQLDANVTNVMVIVTLKSVGLHG
jgi:hypothetical protein